MKKLLKAFLRFFRRRHTLRLKTRMTVYYSLIIVVALCVVAGISLVMFTRTVEYNTTDFSYQIIEQVISNIENYVGDMKKIAATFDYDYDVQKFLKKPETTMEDYFTTMESAGKKLDYIMSLRDDIETILILGDNGGVLSNSGAGRLNAGYSFKRQQWFKEVSMADKPVIIMPHKQSYLSESNNLVFSFASRIKSFGSDEPLGILLIDLNLDMLGKICSNTKLGANGYVFIVDTDGNVIYHPDYSYMYRAWDEMYIKEVFKTDDAIIPLVLYEQSGSFVKNVEGEQKHITYMKVPSTNWTVVGVAPQTRILNQMNWITLAIASIGVLCLIAALLITVFISSLIFKPIGELKNLMRDAESGNFDLAIKVKRNDEIGDLSHSFNQLIRRIKELMNEVVLEEEAKRKAEFKALQAQINPHFLYNTLDSIVWMAECGSRDVVTMADSLAKLFRLSLSKGQQVISIGDEIEHVRNYLIIQSMRYVEKFDYIIDVDPDILEYRTLKLILQPLVENAIYHGIKNKRQKGTIIIKGAKILGHILLEVMDDGAGMDEKQIKNLFTENRSGKGFNGVGVRNVHERIKLYFGEAYGLTYVSQKGVGTVAEIWFPAVSPEENEEKPE